MRGADAGGTDGAALMGKKGGRKNRPFVFMFPLSLLWVVHDTKSKSKSNACIYKLQPSLQTTEKEVCTHESSLG